MKKLLLLLFILMCTPSFAEKIQLTSGQTIRGKFVGRAQDFVRVDTGLGVEVTFYLDEIESVDGEPFNEDIIEGVKEIPEEELNIPEASEKIHEEIPETPAPVQREDLNVKFRLVHVKANEEIEKGNFNIAFKIVENLIVECSDFQENRCLETFDLYLAIVENALIFIDEGGIYEKIDNYAKVFLDQVESFDDLNGMLTRIDKLGEGQRNSYGRLFQVYVFYGLYLASKNDIEGAQAYMLKASKFDANFGKQLQGLIQPYKKIFSDKDLHSLYNVNYDMKLRLSALTEATGIIKVLYDKFQIDPSASEGSIIAQLEKNLNMVKNEVFSFKSEKEFNEKAVPFFIYFLDAETPNFLVWYYKNFGKHSLELKKEMDGKFKSAFISMLNYVLLKARGFDVYYVSTWANPPEKNEADSQESSFFNLFADKKTSSKRVENSLCAVKISDKNFVFVDFLNHWISKKFSLEDVYDKKGEIYYEMKTSINRNDLYGHFQLSKGALVPSNVIVNLLLQMNRMGYQILQDDRSLKLARIKNPYNRNAYQLLAYISYWDNKFSEAINYFNKSLENYKNDPETYYLMGQFYNEAKDYPNSIDSINNALKLDPGLTEAKLLLAFNYQGFRDYGTALEIARDCLKDNSKDPSVHILLSQLYSSFGNISAAKKHAKEAIKFLKLQGNNERAAAVAAYLNSFDEKK